MSTSNYTGLPTIGNGVIQHLYLSTACMHAIHEHCQATQNLEGEPKLPATCKWCAAPCVCRCHLKKLFGDQEAIALRLNDLIDQALAQFDQGFAVNVDAEVAALARELTQ
jgi:hypothetical protein